MVLHGANQLSDQEQIQKLQDENTRLKKELGSDRFKLKLCSFILKNLLRILTLFISGRKLHKALEDAELRSGKIFTKLLQKQYRAAYEEIRRIHPNKLYEFAVAVVVWRIRPRYMLALMGGMFTLLTVVTLIYQSYLLNNQLNLSKIQTDIQAKQAEAAATQSFAFLISSLDPNNKDKNQIAVSLIEEYGNEGYKTIVRVVTSGTNVSYAALEALFAQGGKHEASQVAGTLHSWGMMFFKRKEVLINMKGEANVEEAQRMVQLALSSSAYIRAITDRYQVDRELKQKINDIEINRNSVLWTVAACTLVSQHKLSETGLNRDGIVSAYQNEPTLESNKGQKGSVERWLDELLRFYEVTSGRPLAKDKVRSEIEVALREQEKTDKEKIENVTLIFKNWFSGTP